MGFENGHIARVTLRATKGKAQVVNTLHYDLQGTLLSDAPSLQALADRFRDDVMTPFKALFDNTWIIDGPLVADEFDPLHPDAARASAISSGGGTGSEVAAQTSGHLPYAMCGVAKLKTAHIGRSFTGRIFLPPIFDRDRITDNLVDTTRLTQYTTYVNAIPKQPDLVSGVSSDVANWCVYSRTRRAKGLDLYANLVVSVTVPPRIHWLRSRDDQ